jgi:hypothetical protein
MRFIQTPILSLVTSAVFMLLAGAAQAPSTFSLAHHAKCQGITLFALPLLATATDLARAARKTLPAHATRFESFKTIVKTVANTVHWKDTQTRLFHVFRPTTTRQAHIRARKGLPLFIQRVKTFKNADPYLSAALILAIASLARTTYASAQHIYHLASEFTQEPPTDSKEKPATVASGGQGNGQPATRRRNITRTHQNTLPTGHNTGHKTTQRLTRSNSPTRATAKPQGTSGNITDESTSASGSDTPRRNPTTRLHPFHPLPSDVSSSPASHASETSTTNDTPPPRTSARDLVAPLTPCPFTVTCSPQTSSDDWLQSSSVGDLDRHLREGHFGCDATWIQAKTIYDDNGNVNTRLIERKEAPSKPQEERRERFLGLLKH